MYKLAILDDDTEFLTYLSDVITHKLNLEYSIALYTSPYKLMKDMSENRPDILIADIRLKGDDGIEIVSKIRETDKSIRIIYLTGYIDYSTRIFDTDPSYFLVKPINTAYLLKALQKAETQLAEDGANIAEIYIGKNHIRVYRNELKYVESRMRKLIFHTTSEDIVIYGKLDEASASLSGTFFRCHKSFLVNMRFVKSVENGTAVLITGDEVPVSRSYIKAMKQMHFAGLGDLS